MQLQQIILDTLHLVLILLSLSGLAVMLVFSAVLVLLILSGWATMLVFSAVIYFLTLPVKLFCAVVLLGWVETHFHSDLSPSHHVIIWLNEADAASVLFRLIFVRLLTIHVICRFTLYSWVVLVASLLLLTSFSVDGECIARRQYILEGQARSERLWKLLLGVPEGRDIQEAAKDDDSIASDSSWDWVEMDNAPPLAEPEIRKISKAAARRKFSKGKSISWHELVEIPQSVMKRSRRRSRFVWTDSPGA